MNYISLIETFWAKRLEHSFTCNDIAVYFALVDHCNKLAWKNPFNFSVDELLVKVRLKTKDPLDTARNRLKQAGLIDYKNGDGRGRTTQYWLADPEVKLERGGKRVAKNTPLLSPLFPPLSAPLLPPLEPTVLKAKQKPNETLSSPAGSVPEGAGKSLPASRVAFEVFWDTYAHKQDTRKCQAQWERLSAADQQAAMAHVPAYVAATPDKQYRKYPLTYLNGRCWLDELPAPRSTPAGQPETTPSRAATNVASRITNQQQRPARE